MLSLGCSFDGWKEMSRRQLSLTTWNSRLQGRAWGLSMLGSYLSLETGLVHLGKASK